MKTHNMTDIWKYRIPVTPRSTDMQLLTDWLELEVGGFGEKWAASYGLDEIFFYFQDAKLALICSLKGSS
jgi:hypothetical protein